MPCPRGWAACPAEPERLTRAPAGMRGEPVVEQDGGRARVLGGTRAGDDLLRDARREALVVELDRDRREPRRQSLGERARLGGLRGVAPREPERQPDDHALGFRLAHDRREPVDPAPRVRPHHGLERRRQHARRVADGHAAARAPVVEREDPQPQARSARSIASRATPSASSSFSGSRPPACAIVSRPPPPPPVTCAASLTISPACSPRETSAGATDATNDTLPSPAPPSTTAASPSLGLTRSSTSSSAFWSLAPGTRAVSTRAPSTASASPSSASTSTIAPPPAAAPFA